VEMSFLSGVTMLLGSVWVIAYNVGILRRVRAPAALWRVGTAYVAANRFRTGLTLTMFALVVLSLTVSAVMLTATRVAYADPDAVTGGWDIHVQSSEPPRDLRADLTASGVVSPDAFTTIGAASPLLIEGIQTDAAGAAHWAAVNVVAVDNEFLFGARTPVVAGDGGAWRTLASKPGTAIVGAGLLRAVPNRLRVIDGEGRDFHNVVLWLRDTRGAQPAVRVEVIGLADARGPFGNRVIVNAATLAGWPAPDNGGYYLSVPAGANARE